jgi:hypothetical protein
MLTTSGAFKLIRMHTTHDRSSLDLGQTYRTSGIPEKGRALQLRNSAPVTMQPNVWWLCRMIHWQCGWVPNSRCPLSVEIPPPPCACHTYWYVDIFVYISLYECEWINSSTPQSWQKNSIQIVSRKLDIMWRIAILSRKLGIVSRIRYHLANSILSLKSDIISRIRYYPAREDFGPADEQLTRTCIWRSSNEL